MANFFTTKINHINIFYISTYELNFKNQRDAISSLEFVHAKNKIYLTSIYTEEKFRRKGFATILMEKLLEYCNIHNIEIIYVDAVSKNSTLFFFKHGFDILDLPTMYKKIN